MGKFDGILLCTDLDATLLNDENRVSEENIKAIEYFKAEGGMFTFVTGRVPSGARLMLEYVKPNAPVVTFNGAGIYDFEKNELLWGTYLDDRAKKVIEYVEERVSDLGLVVCADEKVYFPLMNQWVDDYHKLENFPLDTTPYMEISEKWKKALFVTASEDMPTIRRLVAESGYGDAFDFVQSCEFYYEILPKGVSKGTGLARLSEILGVDRSKIIACGDNENDISMIEYAGVGVAVENAIDSLKAAADMVTVSNNEHAIAQIIRDLDDGKLKIQP